MSKSDASPFTPGLPVAPDLFVGRDREVEDLADRAGQAANGRLQVAFLSGERGIGKSSIAAFVRLLAESRHDLLAVHVFLGGTKTVEEMVRRVFDRVAKHGHDKSWFEKIKPLFGQNIQELGLFGINIAFQPELADLAKLADRFDSAVRTVVHQLQPEKSGLLIILDDINGLASSEPFAHWLKSTVDSVATSHEPLPLFLLMVGLEERRRELMAIQPSLARLFHLVEIRPWSRDETMQFYRRAFDSIGVTVVPEALDMMATFAGGLPVLAHEIGDAAIRIDRDDEISLSDASQAVMAAADIVGRKYIDHQVFDAIRSKRYRSILAKIPGTLGFQFKQADVKAHLDNDESKVLDNFLRKMRDLGVLTQNQVEGAGWYEFTSKLHFLYFLAEAKRSRSTVG